MNRTLISIFTIGVGLSACKSAPTHDAHSAKDVEAHAHTTHLDSADGSSDEARKAEASRQKYDSFESAPLIEMIFEDDSPQDAQVDWLPAWGEHSDEVRALALANDCPEEVASTNLFKPYLGCSFSFTISTSNALNHDAEALGASFSYISETLGSANPTRLIKIELAPETTIRTMLDMFFHSFHGDLTIQMIRTRGDSRVFDQPISYIIDTFATPHPDKPPAQRMLIVFPNAAGDVHMCERGLVQRTGDDAAIYLKIGSAPSSLGGDFPSCPASTALDATQSISSDYAVFIRPSLDDPDGFDDSVPFSTMLDQLAFMRSLAPRATLGLPAKHPEMDYEDDEP